MMAQGQLKNFNSTSQSAPNAEQGFPNQILHLNKSPADKQYGNKYSTQSREGGRRRHSKTIMTRGVLAVANS
jgi:hypothetical protein